MRDALGVFLVVTGVVAALLTRDKVWLVVAFAGVTLLAAGVLRSRRPQSSDGREPPIF